MDEEVSYSDGQMSNSLFNKEVGAWVIFCVDAKTLWTSTCRCPCYAENPQTQCYNRVLEGPTLSGANALAVRSRGSLEGREGASSREK